MRVSVFDPLHDAVSEISARVRTSRTSRLSGKRDVT